MVLRMDKRNIRKEKKFMRFELPITFALGVEWKSPKKG